MISQDFGFQINQISKRIARIEEVITKGIKSDHDLDWDNATLLREWKISKRTAANYRQKGLAFYKRGGFIYYSPKNRENFITLKKEPNDGK